MTVLAVYVLPTLALSRPAVALAAIPCRGDVVVFGPDELSCRVEERWLLDDDGTWTIYLTPIDDVPAEAWRRVGFRPATPPDDPRLPF